MTDEFFGQATLPFPLISDFMEQQPFRSSHLRQT